MIQIAFLEPRFEGNIGAIARSMANFNLKDLVLIAPKCDPKSERVLQRAKHAKDIIENARIVPSVDFLDADYLIGTTSALGSDYNIPRSTIRVEQLAGRIAELHKADQDATITVLIGRENDGLTNHEIRLCDFMVTVPAYPEYPVLNASHAAAIIFYELFKHSAGRKTDSHIRLASQGEKTILLRQVDHLLDNMHFSTDEKKETQKKVWRRMVGKSFLTKREAMALIGFMKKLLDKG